MPRNGAGIYTLPQAAFIPGTVISSVAVNSDLSDIALALTGSIAADGQTPITGGLKVTDGSAALPSYSFITNATDGFHHSTGVIGVAINGSDVFTFTSTGITGIGGAVINPVGMVADFAGSVTPIGWFLCYGQAVSRSTYPELFTACGTTWGSGDGSTTFNLPDLRGRAVYGKDDMGGSAANRITVAGGNFNGAVLGGTGGGQNQTLTAAQLALHTHSGTTGSENVDHTHGIWTQTGNTFQAGGFGAPSNVSLGTQSGGISNNHQHAFTSNTGDGVSGTSHAIMNPAAIVNKIIYAGHP